MRIAREIIETLKMELGFLKYKSPNISLEAAFEELKVSFPARVEGFKLDAPDVHSLHSVLSVSFRGYFFIGESKDLVVKDIVDSVHPSFKSLSLNKDDFKVNALQIFNTFVINFKAPALHFMSEGLKVIAGELLNVPDGIVIIKNTEVLGSTIKFRKIEMKSLSKLFEVEFRKSQELPPILSSIDYLPAQYVEKSVILEAVRSLSAKYNISLLKFHGYYRDIPLEAVASLKILPNKNLRVYFDQSKVDRLKRKHLIQRDFIVFKYEDKFVYHLV
ncbi:hypothetical protein SAMN04488510_11512 [Fervidobacterium changbaicum]|uniref:Uncharacterized protein n=1 Tax=Fervidobacterium changbaicum TaxID=310769 RepID=A0ABX5QTN2_9BACT|nr:hypothetical protein [Fervidobacterium changbaicum]QAV33839.1 hypothetical protein CBS1_09060 [Fervidobacterium changbaicum]SDH45025.1 hypothetical protein SAMN04488510_11512 [Fervidobacterium changbaicum]